MNKTELINAIALSSKLSKKDSRKAIEAFIDIASKKLISGEKLTLVGLGVFSIIRREAHPGKNPKTGEHLNIAAKNVIHFRPAYKLALRVR